MPQALIDPRRALDHLLDFLAIEGLSGRERGVAETIRRKLQRAGCRPSWMRHDGVGARAPIDLEIGNLIVELPGQNGRELGRRRLFMGHMDTVPLCRGAIAEVRGKRIVSRGATALGGDNRTAVAALVTMIETLLERRLPHPPLTVLFTVAEEVGLWGARLVDLEDLGGAAMGFNVDGGKPGRIITGAIGADRWEVEVRGRSSHAGLAPEEGISAGLIAGRAISQVARGGWFGKVDQRGRTGTSNVGRIHGGEANNQVMDRLRVTGESRSHDVGFIDRITSAYRQAFEEAARSVTDHRGRCGSVEFSSERDYEPFQMGDDSPPVALALRCARKLRLRPRTVTADGGLDANYLNAKGLPTVTLGAGQHRPHTVDEYVDIHEYQRGCELLVTIASAPEAA